MKPQTVRIGLISDTHIPQRWKYLPESVFSVFANVDLILHAGDVGELWVLDELSQLASVVAVHGNDETDEAVRALPYIQTVSAAGQRIVLTHSHLTDHSQEMASRKEDRWLPKFNTWADLGKQHGATIVVFGHTHIPMVKQHNGIWLINPGAIASGNLYTRQKVQTIAHMTLKQNSPPLVKHFDTSEPDRPHITPTDWDAGFTSTNLLYCEPIFEPELLEQVNWLREHIVPLMSQEHLLDLLLPIAHECWSGKRESVTARDLVDTFLKHSDTLPTVIAKLRESPTFARYL